jgi:hypothetical protein
MFNENIIQKAYNLYWSPQKGENTCGFGAFKIAANFLGIKTTEEEIRRKLIRKRLPLYNSGVFSSYIGILSLDFGFHVQIHTANIILKKLLKEIGNIEKLKEIKVFCEDKKVQTFVESYKKYFKQGGELYIYNGQKKPNFKMILDALKERKKVAIARVTASEYYQIPKERWGHYLTIISLKNNSFLILDCYEKRGEIFYKEKWGKYLQNAKRFNWRNWSDDLIIISNRS